MKEGHLGRKCRLKYLKYLHPFCDKIIHDLRQNLLRLIGPIWPFIVYWRTAHCCWKVKSWWWHQSKSNYVKTNIRKFNLYKMIFSLRRILRFKFISYSILLFNISFGYVLKWSSLVQNLLRQFVKFLQVLAFVLDWKGFVHKWHQDTLDNFQPPSPLPPFLYQPLSSP